MLSGEQILFFVLIIFLGAGTGILFLMVRGLNRAVRVLSGKTDPAEDEQTLHQSMVKRVTNLEHTIAELAPRIETLEKISFLAVQKVAFLRFNPFQDTGGDQSFVVALLDREDNGVILSSLYNREGVRLFAKEIRSGQPQHPLTEEETRVLQNALAKGV